MRMTRLICTLGLVGLLTITGCSSGGAREMLEVRPRATQLPVGATPVLKIPADAKFSITERRLVRNIVTGSKGEAVADVFDDGNAMANATAKDGADTASVFQIGHAVINPSEQQVSIALTVAYDYSFKLTVDPDRGFPDARVSMAFVVNRRQPRLSRSYNLLSISTEDGATESDGHGERTIRFIMDPKSTYDLFIGGEVVSDSKLGRSSGGELQLSNVTLELDGAVAPAVTRADG